MILMYHHVSPDAEVDRIRLGGDGWSFHHTPNQIERHINRLKSNGFQFVSFDQYLSDLLKYGHEPKGCATITFDDGWIDNFIYAAPLLNMHSISGLFFVNTLHLADNLQNKARMNIDHLIELISQGHDIGSHTVSHSILTHLNTEKILYELQESKQFLEKSLRKKIDFFAYPGGAFNSHVSNLVREVGYRCACTVIGPGKNSRESQFNLFRDTFSNNVFSIRDTIISSPNLRKIMYYSSNRKMKFKIIDQK